MAKAKYDVFISFKNTDGNGNPTMDSQMARDLYNALEQLDIPTFFSEKLRKKGEANFKKAIEKALSEARLLVAVGSSRENMEAPWVDKEISTFETYLLNSIKDPTRCTMISYITPDFPPALLPSGLTLRESFTELEPLVEFIVTFLKNGSGFVDQEEVKEKASVNTSAYESKGIVINGRYEIIKEIGRGGFSQIFKARDLQTQTMVAAKVVGLDSRKHVSSEILAGLMYEADIMEELDHPQIPKIHEVIRQSDHSMIIIMDLVEGTTLDQILYEQKQLDEETVLSIAKQMGEILHHLHNRPVPIIYRDVKPENIVLTNEDEVMLLDFGIARRYRRGRTADTTCLGTRGYAAPEQYGGMGQTDARTDIYALGVTLYQLLTGKDPRENGFILEQLPSSKSNLSYGLNYIIACCTEVRADGRFQSVAEFLAALNDIKRISRREKWRKLIWNITHFRLRDIIFRFRLRKEEPAILPPPVANSAPVGEKTGILSEVGETTCLTGDRETMPLTKEAIDRAEAPWWTSAMLKDTTLKIQISFNTGFSTWTTVKIDDVGSESWSPRTAQPAPVFPAPAPPPVPVQPVARNPVPVKPFVYPVPYPAPVGPMNPSDNTMIFTCDARSGDRLSITFEEESYRDPRTLHFLWIGKTCRGERNLRLENGKKVTVTLWKNGEEVRTDTLQIITPEERARKKARERLQAMAQNVLEFHSRLSTESGIIHQAPMEFAAAYYKSVLETLLRMRDPQPVIPFLFVGNPDTGKSRMAQAVAKALNRPFAQIRMESERPQADQQMDMLFFLRRNVKPVLLFEEIEKADRSVIRFLTQLLSGSIPIESAGEFQLEDTIIIVTTCSGAQTLAAEYLQSPCLPQKRILEVLAEGSTLDEDVCRFPDKLLEYTGWQKLILFPPQTIGDLCHIAEVELLQCSMKFRQEYGVDMVFSNQVPQLAMLSGDGLETTEQVKSRVKDLFLEIVLMLFQNFEVNSRLSRLERVDVEVSTWDGERELMSRFEALCRDVSAKLPQDSTAQVPYKLFLGACRDNHATVHLMLQ